MVKKKGYKLPPVIEEKDGKLVARKPTSADMAAITKMESNWIAQQVEDYVDKEILAVNRVDAVAIGMLKALLKLTKEVKEHDKGLGLHIETIIKTKINMEMGH